MEGTKPQIPFISQIEAPRTRVTGRIVSVFVRPVVGATV